MNRIGNKALIVTAPSGSGKTTIVHHLLQQFSVLSFSVSATTRSKRLKEIDGKDYYFITLEMFRQKITSGEFLEWEEVYPSIFYGTLKSEIDRLWSDDKIVIFDVDVKGALTLKKYFGNQAFSLFIKAPSIEALKERLLARGSEDTLSLKARLDKAHEELSYQQHFDKILVNDGLDKAFQDTEILVGKFLKQGL